MTNFTDEELEEINQIIDRVVDSKIQEIIEKLKAIDSIPIYTGTKHLTIGDLAKEVER